MPQPGRLSPEDRGRVTVDLVEQGADVGGRLDLVIEVEAQVAVAPVQGPGPGGLGGAEPGYGKPRPFRADALTPGRTALDDRQVPWAGVAFHPGLVAGMLRHALLAPPARAGALHRRA